MGPMNGISGLVPRLALAIVGLTAALLVVAATASWFANESGRPPEGLFKIYVMDADGDGLDIVAPDLDAIYQTPAWSPDGQSLAVSMGRIPGPPQIVVIDMASNLVRPLTEGVRPEWSPRWSPDGSTLVFLALEVVTPPPGPPLSSIYTVRADGTNLRKISDLPEPFGVVDWSPDGNSFVLGSRVDGGWQLFVMNTDGSERLKLETGGGDQPSWSPDGRTLAFMSDRNDQQGDLYSFDFATGAVRRLTDSAAFDMQPAWSPDGKLILFMSQRERAPMLFTMRPDGTNVVNLSKKSGVRGVNPVWSPDGKRIAFQSIEEPREP